MTCTDCSAESHQNQTWLFPLGKRVVAIREIANTPNEPVPFGAIGTVTGHCDDGRAHIQFYEYSGSHTFHVPEFYIAAESTNGK
jgi:hypothetical protein